MRYLALVTLLICVLCSCGQKQDESKDHSNEESKETEVIKASPQDDPLPEGVGQESKQDAPILADPVLHKVEKLREFSTPGKKDHFLLTMTGDSVMTAWVHFKIFDPTGEEIYTVDFESWLLVDYGLMAARDADSTMTEERYVQTRLDSFFTESKFSQPAIGSEERFFPEMSDRIIWEEIKSLPESVGFFYLLGVEDGRSLAWSPRQKEVVMYMNCC